MPVILNPGSDELRTWLDPGRYEWSRELQSLLKPFEGELEVYSVSKDVGKVGNNSPSFVIPLDSKENKSNIANFFANASRQQIEKKGLSSPAAKVKADPDGGFQKSPEKSAETEPSSRPKRKVDHSMHDGPPTKKAAPPKITRAAGKISATKNDTKSPVKSKAQGVQKITNFFNSA